MVLWMAWGVQMGGGGTTTVPATPTLPTAGAGQ